MDTSTPGLQTFNTAFPFDMQMKNQFQSEELAILYITDNVDPTSAAQQVEFSFTQSGSSPYTIKGFDNINPSNKPTIPAPATGTVCTPTDSGFTPNDTNQSQQYNLAITFRPGTLRDQVANGMSTSIYNALTAALPDNPCVVNGPITRASDGASIWYCAFKNDLTTSTSWKLSFMLKGITAAAGVGTRSTQVECLFANILLNNTGNPLQFRRSYHVDIINHEGHSYAPLFFSVLGNNTILIEDESSNDTKPTSFSLYLETIGRQPLQFNTETKIVFSLPYAKTTSESMYFGNSSEVMAYGLDPVFLSESIEAQTKTQLTWEQPAVQIPYAAPSSNPASKTGRVEFTAQFQPIPTLAFTFNGQQVKPEQWTTLILALIKNYADDVLVWLNRGGTPANALVSASVFNQDQWIQTLTQCAIDERNADFENTPLDLSQSKYNFVPASPSLLPRPDGEFNWQQDYTAYFKKFFLDEAFVTYLEKNYSNICPKIAGGRTTILPSRDVFNYLWVSYQQSSFLDQFNTLISNDPLHDAKFSLIKFDFSNVQVSGVEGMVNVGISLQNLPGYWDTNFQVSLVKVKSRIDVNLNLPDGGATIGKNLSVTGTSSLTGTITASNDLTVTGSSELNGGATVNGGATLNGGSTVSGGTTISGDATMNNDLTVTGKTTLNGKVAVNNDLAVTDGFLSNSYNVQTPPTPSDDGGLAIGWNKSSHKAEVNFYNAFQTGKPHHDGPSMGFQFLAYVQQKWKALMTITGGGRIQDITGDVMPVGSIIAYGGSAPPPGGGWLRCDGQSIKTPKKYADLRAVVGNNVPDLRSRFVVGAGQGAGLSNYAVTNTGGEENHTLSQTEMPTHEHNADNGNTNVKFMNGYLGQSGAPTPSNPSLQQDQAGYVTGGAWGNSGFSGHTDVTGDGDAHNNLPPYYALTYMIKY